MLSNDICGIFNINNTKVTIKCGDLFEQAGYKVISFNEYFDTLVDDNIISHKTLNGIFIDKFIDDLNAIDSEIEKQIKINNFKIKDNVRPSGKTVQCKLGSIVKYKDFLLLAFSKFLLDDKATLTADQYIACLKKFWYEIDRVYAGYPVSLPLLGSGITRLKMSNHQLLKEILDTFDSSKVKLIAGLNIVLHGDTKNDIGLKQIGYLHCIV